MFGVGFSPFLAQQLWDDPFIIMSSPWYKILLFTGIALIFIPTILSSVIGVGKVTKGTSAVGVITGVKQTGLMVNNQPELRISFMVTQTGQPKYPAELKTVIPLSALAQFQPGALIPLLVSEKDPSRIGLDVKGQLSQEQLQAMMDEQLMKRGVSADLMDIARNGERAYAKVLDVVPLGTSGSDRIKLRLTMSITKSNGDVFEVVTEKEVSDAVLPKVQQGNIVRVVYSPQDPSKLVLEMQATDADVKGTFGA